MPDVTDPSYYFATTISVLPQSSHLCWQPHGQTLPQRRWQRVQYPHSVLLTPFDEAFTTQTGSSIVVDGRDISVGGFSFRHLEPIIERYVVISFPMETTTKIHRALKLTWCRFLQRGIYESGGKFLHSVDVDDLVAKNVFSAMRNELTQDSTAAAVL